jgi:hypothetical protein
LLHGKLAPFESRRISVHPTVAWRGGRRHTMATAGVKAVKLSLC